MISKHQKAITFKTLESSKKEVPRAFCVAPWVHAHVGADGDRRICGISRKAPPEYSKLPWNEFKNSDYMKKIRTQMLNNQVPAECANCEVPNRTEVYRDALNQQYKGSIDRILKGTGPDGQTSELLRYLDYRSNLCNLKCRTCSPVTSSTSHAHVLKDYGPENRRLFYDLNSTNPKSILEFFKSNYAGEIINFCSTEAIDRIYYAGGEPFLEDSHLKTLNELLTLKKADKIELFYNTNLSYPLKMLEEWLPLASQFKQVYFLISIDGAGSVTEYIREGMKLSTFEKNLSYLTENKTSKINLTLDLTLTSLNLFFLEDFAKYVLSKKIRTQAKLMVESSYSFPLLRCEVIHPEIKKLLLQQWENYYGSLSTEEAEFISGLNDGLKIYKNSPHKEFKGMADMLWRLETYERLHPQSLKFFDILKTSQLGGRWLEYIQTAT